MTVIVNGHQAELYSDAEVVIQLNPRHLEATQNKVYLTRRELVLLLNLTGTSIAEVPVGLADHEKVEASLDKYMPLLEDDR